MNYRREVLVLTGALLAGIAGCTGDEDEADPREGPNGSDEKPTDAHDEPTDADVDENDSNDGDEDSDDGSENVRSSIDTTRKWAHAEGDPISTTVEFISDPSDEQIGEVAKEAAIDHVNDEHETQTLTGSVDTMGELGVTLAIGPVVNTKDDYVVEEQIIEFKTLVEIAPATVHVEVERDDRFDDDEDTDGDDATEDWTGEYDVPMDCERYVVYLE